MGQFKLHWEATSPVPPKSARAWFFDLTENDHAHPDHAKVFKGSPPTRKILSRTKDEVKTEEHIGKRTMHATLRLAGADALAISTAGKGMSSEGLLRFMPDGKGTKVVVDTTFTTKGMATLFMPMMRKQFTTVIPADMDIHVREMTDEWAKKPW